MDRTAERVALWRALHVAVDAPPHVLTDEVGLRLAAPADGWRDRPDMHPDNSRGPRATMVARARFVEDTAVASGLAQYVVLGSGLDTFVQRRPAAAAAMRVFEVDRPAPQEWKRQRLVDLGYGVPEHLRLVPVDFETADWWQALLAAGFNPELPAVVASTGVSMYLTAQTVAATLRRLATLAPGSTFVMTFHLPEELIDEDDRPARRAAVAGARAAGTPFVSFYRPAEIVTLALDSGFATARHVSAAELTDRYFAGRTDGLRPSTAEEFLLATT